MNGILCSSDKKNDTSMGAWKITIMPQLPKVLKSGSLQEWTPWPSFGCNVDTQLLETVFLLSIFIFYLCWLRNSWLCFSSISVHIVHGLAGSKLGPNDRLKPALMRAQLGSILAFTSTDCRMRSVPLNISKVTTPSAQAPSLEEEFLR